MSDPGAFWDSKYEGETLKYGDRPNTFLVDQSYRLPPNGKVLVPGDGEGRNGVWLARQGWRVRTVDASARGVQKAAALALKHGVTLRTEVADLRSWAWPVGEMDGIVATFLHAAPELRPGLHRRMMDALAPGGLIILQGFRPEQLPLTSGGPKDVAMLFTEDMLREDFAGLEIDVLSSTSETLDEGPFHQGPAELIGLVARKPA